MSTRKICGFAALAALAFATPGSLALRGAAATPPKPANVVVIVVDDMGFADNSVFKDMGGRFPTPNLERLARSGVRFTNAYVSAPICAPSRAGLMTGRYQQRFGFEYLIDSPRDVQQNLGMDPKEITMGDVMRKAGFHTGLIGKWHLGANDSYYPTNRAFDDFFGFLGGGTNYISSSSPDYVASSAGGAEVPL